MHQGTHLEVKTAQETSPDEAKQSAVPKEAEASRPLGRVGFVNTRRRLWAFASILSSVLGVLGCFGFGNTRSLS